MPAEPDAGADQHAERDPERWLATLGRVMSHPTRLTILQALAGHCTASPSDVAAAASVSLGSYAYHMRILSALGMVRLKRIQRVRGAQEHFYELTNEGAHALRAIETALSAPPRPHKRPTEDTGN